MKLNTTTQYAIKVMSHMAKNDDNNFYNAKDISEKLSIPYKYLTRIMAKLVNSNIITSTRGREGGYSLSKKPEQINIIDILKAMDENIVEDSCLLGTGSCNENKRCSMHDKWKEPKESMQNMFQKTSLKDIS